MILSVDVLYYFMLTTFICHELDAMQRHEWRVLPLTRFLPDQTGRQVFLWLHLPLLFLIFWLGEVEENYAFKIGLSAFAIIHVGLHWMFRKHEKYEFNNPSSWALIILSGAAGALYIAEVLK
jgi:cbb3-type cytochrome oxidase subunit 3